jgi:hypothetical protein
MKDRICECIRSSVFEKPFIKMASSRLSLPSDQFYNAFLRRITCPEGRRYPMNPAKGIIILVMASVIAGCAGMSPTQHCSEDSCALGAARGSEISDNSGEDSVAGAIVGDARGSLADYFQRVSPGGR